MTQFNITNMMSSIIYKISFNRSKKTYTIKRYINGKLIYPYYRSNPQGTEYTEEWTQNDIKSFLKNSNDYYLIDKF